MTQKIKQYADDTTFLLKDLIDFREILSKIKIFSLISGLHINKAKTFAMKIGNGGDHLNEYNGILFGNRIKLLGICFSNHTSARQMNENWEGRIEKLERNLTMWARRHLTLFGKVVIIKTFGISQFVTYLLS